VNEIAYKGGNGVAIEGPAASENYFRDDIFDNGGLAIDLGADGATPNDPGDADVGPNDFLNEPVLTAAFEEHGSLYVSGTVSSFPNRIVGITGYFSSGAGRGGHGDAQVPLYDSEGVTGPDGIGHFDHLLVGQPGFPYVGWYASLTAYDGRSMSEVSNSLPIVSIPLLQLRVSAVSIDRNGSAVIEVVNDGGYSLASTVHYSTEDGTAVAGRDYEPASGTLSFAPRETTKSITIKTLPGSSPQALLSQFTLRGTSSGRIPRGWIPAMAGTRSTSAGDRRKTRRTAPPPTSSLQPRGAHCYRRT
jgi:hypothetical protein